jgi:hypothetical protein
MGSREQAIREWADAVSQTDRGCLLLVNLAHEIVYGSIPPEVLSRLVTVVADAWLENAGRSTAMQVFRDGLKRIGAEALCQGQPTLQPPQRCSRIMTAPDFVRHHVKLEKGGLTPEVEVPLHLIQRLEDEGLENFAQGTLKTAQPVVWVTDSRQVESVRASSAPPSMAATGSEICEIATQLRERLGLNHYADDQQLLELVYPEALPGEQCQLHPPTVLDGIGSIYYRSGRTHDGWGVTVDLTSGGAGLPEAVHPPTCLTSEFRVRNLGRIRGNNTQIDYRRVAGQAPTQWSDEVLNQFVGYLEEPSHAAR